MRSSITRGDLENLPRDGGNYPVFRISITTGATWLFDLENATMLDELEASFPVSVMEELNE